MINYMKSPKEKSYENHIRKTIIKENKQKQRLLKGTKFRFFIRGKSIEKNHKWPRKKTICLLKLINHIWRLPSIRVPSLGEESLAHLPLSSRHHGHPKHP